MLQNSLYTDSDSKTFLERVKREQKKIEEQITWHVEEYNKINRVWKANENLIASLEESLGLREPRKNKSKANSEKEDQPEPTQNSIDTHNNYDKVGTVAGKATYALAHMKKESTISEILDFLYTIDNTMQKADKRTHMSNYAATLKQKLDKDEIFYRKQNKDGALVWGLKQWDSLKLIN